jgi:hypothetical protein
MPPILPTLAPRSTDTDVGALQAKRVLSPELREVWSLAEGLARSQRACVGKHGARRYALVSRRSLPLSRARPR